MSAWSRIAVLAAGAAVGAAVGRLANDDAARRTVDDLAQRGRAQLEAAGSPQDETALQAPPTGSAEAARPLENRLGSRALRIAQDIRAGMDQRERELREQLSLRSPEQARTALPGVAAPEEPAGPEPHPVLEHDWRPPGAEHRA